MKRQRTEPGPASKGSKRPNVLILMVDQLAGTFWPDGPAPFLKTPHLRALAAQSARFSNAYCSSPLCSPSRASFMTGKLPSATRVYDNAAEWATDMPTFAHHLRKAGYQTCLSGKMHFVGPDQLHGFEERLTPDIYPADYGWTPDYAHPEQRVDWWYHNLASVTNAGTARITNQLEFDDEVANAAERKLYDYARKKDGRPWCLCVSFTHPHDPYVARQKYFDLYKDCAELEPTVTPIPYEELDNHSKRLYEVSDHKNYDIKPEHIRRARQAYFGNISYLDEQIGRFMNILESCGMDDNTSIVFLGDHGDLLGERGLWYKMTFLDPAARIPLMIRAPGLSPALVATPVSALDIVPTLAHLAAIPPEDIAPWHDGTCLIDNTHGGWISSRGAVEMEYAAEGSVAPMVSIRDGRWKYIQCSADPPQLFDLESDPHELRNLADVPEYHATAQAFAERIKARWDLSAFDREVRQSQARRHVVYQALRQGKYAPWDHQPVQDASSRFMRNHMDLNVVEASQRA